MRPMWYATHAVVDRMERDPEFAWFVHDSETRYKAETRYFKIILQTDSYKQANDEPFEIVYLNTDHPDWTIRIVTNWDRSKTTISFPGEEIEEEAE